MALQPSGTMSIGGPTSGRSINLELGRSATATSSLGESDLRTLAQVPSGAISISNFHGKSNISASGGFTSEPGNGYKYHVFTTSGAFAVSAGNIGVEYLVVASGGSGSARAGGGAGAGGGLHNIPGVPGNGSAMTCPPGTYPVTVATSGGSPVSGPTAVQGNKGSDSVFNSITAEGGGAATNHTTTNCPVNIGGCGGSSHDFTCPRVGNQGGNGGGSGDSSPTGNVSGGNGGAGKAYGTGFAGPLIGAIMTANSIPSPEVSAFQTAVGPTGLYAGGGGGGTWQSPTVGPGGGGGGGMGGDGTNTLGPGTNGAGGSGGGGTGGIGPGPIRASTPGVKYTGGGGGGSGGESASGAGGAGIVILRYQV